MNKLKGLYTFVCVLIIVLSQVTPTYAADRVYIASVDKPPIAAKGLSTISVPTTPNSKVIFKAPKSGTYKFAITDIISADESARLKIQIGKKKFKALETRYILHYQNSLFENGMDRNKAIDKGYKLSSKLYSKGWSASPINVKVKMHMGQKLTIKHSAPKSKNGYAESVVYDLRIKKVK